VPRISVVVALYNVERYASECLESVAAQTVRDLEVVMVDDGATDSTAAIAQRFADGDERFRLIRKPNGGLGSARNAGADAAAGEFLAFVDGDDLLPPHAYERLLSALEETGSDFATGNVLRLRAGRRSLYVPEVYDATRLRTHVTRFRPLLADRIAPNKLWRRSFWDAHALRFPEGVVHEDIPVVIPAHFMAKSVDVIEEPVYVYRMRDTGEPSITDRRLEQRVLLDRLAAVEHVRDFLAREGPREARRWYEESLVADDLRYFMDVLDRADADYRRLFVERVNAFLDTAGKRIYRPLPAIQRLKWHLARHRHVDELVEVLRFQRYDLRDTPNVRIRGRWYGDYPYRQDRRLKIPRSVYRLRAELRPVVRVERLRVDGERLHVDGWAFISGIGAPEPDSQRVRIVAVAPGRFGRLRRALPGHRFRTMPVHRPELAAPRGQGAWDLAWSGFSASLDTRRLTAAGDAEWRLALSVRAGRVRGRPGPLWGERTPPPRAVDLPAGDGARVVAQPIGGRRVAVRARAQWAVATECRLTEDALELRGRLGGPASDGLRAQLTRDRRSPTLEYALAVDGDRLELRLPLADLLAHDRPGAPRWVVDVVGAGRRHRLLLADAAPDAAWGVADRQLAVYRTEFGDLAVKLRAPSPLATEARWDEDGALALTGALPGLRDVRELVLIARHRLERHRFPLTADGERFGADLAVTRMPSLAGERPLAEGDWELHAATGADLVPVLGDRALGDRLPIATVVDHKRLSLGVAESGLTTLSVQRDLDDDERGPIHRRRLRDGVYAPARSVPLRNAVVYTSFGGRQCSDSPRAIFAELVRRAAPLEHFWVVEDARFPAPAGATALRAGSRAHHEALARARYVVTNDELPGWFERRPDQVCLQTWHGTPLKRAGADIADMRDATPHIRERWHAQAANWQFVVSPSRFATPILRRAFALTGEVLETGYPRADALAAPARGADVRRVLGLPDGVRTVLYAPTYRDGVRDRDRRLRLDDHLDVDVLRRALGGDAVILYRCHPKVIDAAPATDDGFVRDVSSYPDATELLLAADVLVTDYSSLMVDFANTGRPIVLYAYDLEAFRDHVRGLYVDLEALAPGPIVRTGEELAEALRAPAAPAYEEFAATFCEFDDGRATERVVNRVFGPAGS
jgi:CDP-glycerol glycerophosphotransferase